MKTPILLMVLFLFIGELQAIDHQTVTYGEDIKQYALTTVMQNGYSYVKPCEDCICYITVTNTKNKKFINAHLMNKLELGLYGYEAKASVLPPGPYRFLANCTSVLTTGGIEISDLMVTDNTLSNENNTNTVSCQAYDTCSGLNCIGPGLGCVSDKLTILSNSVITLVGNISNFLQKLTRNGIINGIKLSFYALFVAPIALIITAILTPVALFMPLLILVFGLTEIFIIGYVVFTAKNNNAYEWVTSWAKGHYILVNSIKNFIFRWV